MTFKPKKTLNLS